MKYFFVVTKLLFSYHLFGQQPGYKIDVKIEGIKEDVRVVLFCEKEGLGKVDTVSKTIPINGTFSFTGYIPIGPQFYFIGIEGQNNYLQLFLDNSIIKIEGNINQWPIANISGSPSHDEYKVYQDIIAPLQNIYDSLMKEMQKAYKSKDTIAFKDIGERQMRIALLNKEQATTTFIAEHPGSSFTPVLLLQRSITISEKREAYEKLLINVQKSLYGKILKEKIDDKIRFELGGTPPDFTSITPTGKTLSLKQIVRKNKLTLIDFWASWCVPCREETPYVKKAYDKFHKNGLVILSVSFDNDKNEWLKAIKKDKMNWYHVSDLKGRRSAIHQLYSINGIPQTYLLDTNGKIVGINLRGDELYNTIENIMASKITN